MSLWVYFLANWFNLFIWLVKTFSTFIENEQEYLEFLP